jgi:hypothetical protein
MVPVLMLLVLSAGRAEEKAESAESTPSRELVIQAQGGKESWDAPIEDVEKVLHSAAAQLWKHFSDRRLHPIVVLPKGGPIVLYQRGKKGEYRVLLNTGGTYWAQYAFQFAHEFTHILCGYKEGDSGTLWFEESLCELGSLYALRRMAEEWEKRPPYRNWKSFGPKLAAYAEERLKKAALKEGVTLAKWYAEHAEKLKADGTQRELNTVVAAALLPIIEKSPGSWEAVAYWNEKKTKDARSFERCLIDWRASVPEKHRSFVEEVAGRFGVKLR